VNNYTWIYLGWTRPQSWWTRPHCTRRRSNWPAC